MIFLFLKPKNLIIHSDISVLRSIYKNILVWSFSDFLTHQEYGVIPVFSKKSTLMFVLLIVKATWPTKFLVSFTFLIDVLFTKWCFGSSCPTLRSFCSSLPIFWNVQLKYKSISSYFRIQRNKLIFLILKLHRRNAIYFVSYFSFWTMISNNFLFRIINTTIGQL